MIDRVTGTVTGRKGNAGSAYLYVAVIMMTLFLLTAVALGITASARRMSARYIQYGGLYALAVDSKAHAFAWLEGALREVTSELTAVWHEDMAEWRERRETWLAALNPDDYPHDECFEEPPPEVTEAEIFTALAGRFAESWGRIIPGLYYRSYRLYVGDDYFLSRTELERSMDGFIIRTHVYKSVNGVAGFPVGVEARITLFPPGMFQMERMG